MKRRGALPLALVGAGLIAVAVRRRRPRTRRARLTPMIPFLALWNVLRSSQDVNFPTDHITDLLNSAFGGLSTLIGWAVGPVVDALASAAGAAENYARGLFNQVTSVIGTIASGFASIADWIWSIRQELVDYIDYVRDIFGQFLSDLLDDALRAGGAIWNLIHSIVEDVVDGILGTAEQFLNTIRNIVEDALQDLANGAAWFTSLVEGIVSNLWHVLIGTGESLWNLIKGFAIDSLLGALQEADWIWNWVRDNIIQPMIDAALSEFGDIIDIVLGAADFLRWIVEHPLDWFTEQLEGVFADGASAFLDRVGNAIEENQDAAESFLDRIFG